MILPDNVVLLHTLYITFHYTQLEDGM